MATIKISALPAITSNSVTSNDLFHVIDVDATSQTYPTGTNKKVTASILAERLAALNTTTIPPVVQTELDLKLSIADFNGVGLKIAAPVVAATIAPVTLTGLTAIFANAIIDGVTLVAGDRLLVKNQSTTSENGIYIISTTPTIPVRATDFNEPTEINNGFVLVNGGTTQNGSGWAVTSTVTVSPSGVGTDPIVFTQFASGLSGLSKSSVGLGNVDNTSDISKPLSTATITALAGKQGLIGGAASTITTSNLGASRALVSDVTGKVAASATVTSAQLGYLTDVTSNIQAQLDNKAPLASPTFTGNVALPSTTTVGGTVIGTIPAGAVMAFAMNSAPAGWLVADGTAVSRATYANLFTAIGTLYPGGDGATTFAVPDLRGYFVRGTGTNSDGTVSGTFAAKQADEFKSHTHTVDNIVLVPGYQGSGGGLVGRSSANSGSTGGTETRPRNIAMLYCIKF
jgi:hypothetical protein